MEQMSKKVSSLYMKASKESYQKDNKPIFSPMASSFQMYSQETIIDVVPGLIPGIGTLDLTSSFSSSTSNSSVLTDPNPCEPTLSWRSSPLCDSFNSPSVTPTKRQTPCTETMPLVTETKKKKLSIYDTRYVCCVCDRPFKRKQELDRHQFCHTGERRFFCDYSPCQSKGFSRKDALIRHQRSHKSIKKNEKKKRKSESL